jgi:hypothetical protein
VVVGEEARGLVTWELEEVFGREARRLDGVQDQRGVVHAAAHSVDPWARAVKAFAGDPKPSGGV